MELHTDTNHNKMTAIIIVTYNVPDLVLHQANHLKHFCKDDYELIIVDNSNNQDAIDAIAYHAKELGCELIKTNSHLKKN